MTPPANNHSSPDLSPGRSPDWRPLDLSLYLVADHAVCQQAGADLPEVVARSVAAGTTVVQIRAKELPGGAFTDLAAQVCAVLPPSVPLLINDRIDVVLALRRRGLACAGAHVGQADLDVRDVRALLGDEAVIGLSAASPQQLRAAHASAARIDYVGIGPLHSTRTKRDAPAGLGIDTVIERARDCTLPAVAIGGITPADMPALRSGGLAGAAVVSYICASADPGAATERLAAAWNAAPTWKQQR